MPSPFHFLIFLMHRLKILYDFLETCHEHELYLV